MTQVCFLRLCLPFTAHCANIRCLACQVGPHERLCKSFFIADSHLCSTMTPAVADSSISLPLDQLITRLHKVAGRFWSHPETADCSIVVPLPIAARPSISPVAYRTLIDTSRRVRPSDENFSSGFFPTTQRDRSCSSLLSYSLSSSRRDSDRSDFTDLTSATELTTPSARNDSSHTSPGHKCSSPCPLLASSQDADGRRCSAPGISGMAHTLNQCEAHTATEPATASVDGSFGNRGRFKAQARQHTFRLHRDYLVTQSTLLRKFFSTVTSLHLDSNAHSYGSSSSSSEITQDEQKHSGKSVSDQTSSRSFSAATRASQHSDHFSTLIWSGTEHDDMAPRFLNSSETHPVLYLPLPDPLSFGELLRYFYHGDVAPLIGMLERGLVNWAGLILNANFLGVTAELKDALGRWWASRAPPSMSEALHRRQLSSALQGYRLGGRRSVSRGDDPAIHGKRWRDEGTSPRTSMFIVPCEASRESLRPPFAFDPEESMRALHLGDRDRSVVAATGDRPRTRRRGLSNLSPRGEERFGPIHKLQTTTLAIQGRTRSKTVGTKSPLGDEMDAPMRLRPSP